MDTILVVEDERAIREMLGQGLRKRGYEVLVAVDGDEAVRMCSKHPKTIKVLLCDIVTPGLRAHELIRIPLRIYPDLRVLLRTGYPDEHAFGSGDSEIFQLIRKPVLLLNWFSGWRQYWEKSVPDDKLGSVMAELRAIDLLIDCQIEHSESAADDMPLSVLQSRKVSKVKVFVYGNGDPVAPISI
jgi:CheY-like chemotaxis protein